MTATPGSLTGIRVIEIGTSIAAPFATQILADLGAEVIKVERPDVGDDSRRWSPPSWDGVSVPFLSVNRGKRSVVVDYKQPDGMATLHALIASADVLVQNLRPGALEAVGLGADRLQELNDQLVYCDMSGFGPAGPMAGRPAYDPLLQAYSGLVSITGDATSAPARVPVPILDMGTGVWAVVAIFEALRRRDRDGHGCHVELSLLQTALAWLGASITSILAGDPAPERLGSGMPGTMPYGAFPSSDGYVFIAAANDGLWTKLCTALDASHLLARDDFATNSARVVARSAVNEALGAVTGRLATAQIVDRLTAAGVPCSPIQTLDQVVVDPQVVATGMIRPVHHPHIADFRGVALPATFDRQVAMSPLPPPELGADTEAVISTLP